MKKIVGFLSIAIFAATAAFAQDKAQAEKDDAILKKYFAEHKIKASKTASGLYYVVTQKGSGENAKPGQTVSVNYTGHTMDGQNFDSNVLPEFNHVQPLIFPIGQHRVIAGWDEGICLLNKGEKATLYIPSQLAYGERANGKIPANAILIFDVELLEAK